MAIKPLKHKEIGQNLIARMGKYYYLTFGPPGQSTSRIMYTKVAYEGNTSAVVGRPLGKKELKEFLDYLVNNFDKLLDVDKG